MVASLSPSARLRALSSELHRRVVDGDLHQDVGNALRRYVYELRMLVYAGRVDPGRALALAVVVDGINLPPLEDDRG